MTGMGLRRQHLVRHLHRLGECAVGELLIEVAKAHDIEPDILARLERYGLNRDTLAVLGADRLAPLPLQLVEDAA